MEIILMLHVFGIIYLNFYNNIRQDIYRDLLYNCSKIGYKIIKI